MRVQRQPLLERVLGVEPTGAGVGRVRAGHHDPVRRELGPQRLRQSADCEFRGGVRAVAEHADQPCGRDFCRQFNGNGGTQQFTVEKEFLRLILQGEKQQAAFVQVLARYGPIKHAGREVKNVKARLLRKLQALAEEMGYEANDLINE